MGRKRTGETALQWLPTAEQSPVLDCLAMGLSQNAASRETGVPYQTINGWVNNLSFSDAFREEVVRRAELFQENLGAIEDQMVVQATAVVAKAIAGELERERGGLSGTKNTLQYDAAVEFLRATRWKRISGGHQQFGIGINAKS